MKQSQLISLAGFSLILFGVLVLPMITMFSPYYPTSGKPGYEWDIVTNLFYNNWQGESVIIVIAAIPMILAITGLVLLIRSGNSSSLISGGFVTVLLGGILHGVFTFILSDMIAIGVNNELALGFYTTIGGFLVLLFGAFMMKKELSSKQSS